MADMLVRSYVTLRVPAEERHLKTAREAAEIGSCMRLRWIWKTIQTCVSASQKQMQKYAGISASSIGRRSVGANDGLSVRREQNE